MDANSFVLGIERFTRYVLIKMVSVIALKEKSYRVIRELPFGYVLHLFFFNSWRENTGLTYLCPVRKPAAIFFLTLLLLAQTPLQQLLRLPVFIEHFSEHRAESPGLSLSFFIVLHYFSGNPKDDDYDRDMQLPFRAHDVVMISGTIVLPAQVEPSLSTPIFERRVYPLMSERGPLPRHRFDIFQPPRHC
jgi:hypothetical protein